MIMINVYINKQISVIFRIMKKWNFEKLPVSNYVPMKNCADDIFYFKLTPYIHFYYF